MTRDADADGLQPLPYAHDPLTFYPGSGVTAEDLRRMDSFDFALGDISADFLVRSMGRQIERNFQMFFTTAEAVVGEEQALRIARTMGERYGGLGYARFLESRGCPGQGSPSLMAEFQDLAHSIRGPKHASALFARRDETRVSVERSGCVYYSEDFPENAKYVGAFEAGVLDAYRSVDANIVEVTNQRCRWQGEASCSHTWRFAAPEAGSSPYA